MGMDLRQDTVSLRQMVGRMCSQAVVEGEVALPDDRPDMERMLLCDARMVVSSVELLQNKVMVNGTVTFSNVYLSTQGRVECMTNTFGFSHSVDVEGAAPKMMVRVAPVIEHIQCERLSGRRGTVQAVVNLCVMVWNPKQVQFYVPGGDAEVEVATQSMKWPSYISEGSTHAVIREEMELSAAQPPADTVLLSKIHCKDLMPVTLDGRVEAQGEMVLQATYATGDEEVPVAETEQNIPIQVAVDIPEAREGQQAEMWIEVEDIYIQPLENAAGERTILRAEISIKAQACLWDQVESDVVTDAYSPAHMTQPVYNTYTVEQPAASQQQTVMVKAELMAPASSPPMGRVLEVKVLPSVTSVQKENDQLTVDGVLEGEVLYLPSDSSGLSSFVAQAPFRLELPDGEELTDQRLLVDHVSQSLIAPDSLEVRAAMSLDVETQRPDQYQVLTDLEVSEDEPERVTGMIIHFAKDGETVWDIAKNYFIAQDEVLHYNPELPDSLAEGERVILYLRKDQSA